jgi:hypothetical protein
MAVGSADDAICLMSEHCVSANAFARLSDLRIKPKKDADMATPNEKSRTITIKTGFEGDQGGATDASAYLFDRSGALIASAPVSKDVAKLTIDALPRGARLLIGPTLEKTERAEPPTIAALERLTAFEPKTRFRPDLDIYDIGKVPELVWPHWPLCRCRVKGRVMVRRTSPGGVVVEAPVCNARVHICEVDRFPWLIERLPDPDIFRLRDELIDIIRQPLPWPPEPVPWRELTTLPGVPLASQVISNGRVGAVVLNPQPLPPRGIVALNPQPLPPLSRIDAVAFNPQPDPPVDPFRDLPKAMQFSLQSHSASIIRRTLLDHIELVRPWICRWPWLHRWFYSCDELRVVTTDDQGRFEATIWYPCHGDKPDLYFWVDYSIGGAWTPVHRPPIPCNVWWDYLCGTEVTITVTDPRVPGCGEVPELFGKQVVVKTIARQVSMGEISRDNSGADPALVGTVKAGWLHPTKESPFGATLEPRVDFGKGLKPAGITHYRWSYRPYGSVDESAWAAIQADVFRHYREIPASVGAPTIYKSARVGPDPAIAGGYFFEVEPALPAGGEDWEVLDESYDLASAYWDTAALMGKYELKLELFRKTGATMTRVDLTAEGVGLNQVTDPAPLTGSTYTATAATPDRTIIDPGTGHIVGYRLALHVDNRTCFGTIETVVVAPGANDTKCGFLEYAPGAAAQISFRASHPGNYAYFDFNVSRVATALPNASADGTVDVAVTTPTGFIRSGDTFSKAVTVASLLNDALPAGETPCTRAAFGQSLSVYALATNGYGRLSGYDAPNTTPPGQIGLRAFAITPA